MRQVASSPSQVQKKTKMKQPKGKPDAEKSYPISWIIVNVHQFLLLFSFCIECGSRLVGRKVRFRGATVLVDYVCSKWGHSNTWQSSPSSHHYSHLNSMLSFSVTLSGIRFAAMQHFMELSEIPFISIPVFNNHRMKWLFPVIVRMYDSQKSLIVSRLKALGNKLTFCGDAQFDSPGFSAKYCTYSMMNCANNEIVDFIVVQKGQYNGELEKQACQLLLEILVGETKLDIGDFVTDRHTGIGAMMREIFPSIFHAYDVWHMGKSLLKKLTACAKKHPKVGLWTRALVRHFWWCCKECEGNVNCLLEMYHSSLFHLLNIHNWARRRKIHEQFSQLRIGTKPYPAKPQIVTKCSHNQLLVRTSRETPWFKIEDDDFKAVFKIITATKFSNDVKKCCKFIHTGKLESFHSLKLMYLPKSTGFTMTTTIVLTMLTAIQNNCYLDNKNKQKTYSVRQWSRANKEHIVKDRHVYDNITFKKIILEQTFENIKENRIINLDLSSYIRSPIPKTFHCQTAPSKEQILAKKNSRMS